MANIIYRKKHKKGCEAVEWTKKGIFPAPWEIVGRVDGDSLARKVKTGALFTTWLRCRCLQVDCPAVVYINAHYLFKTLFKEKVVTDNRGDDMIDVPLDVGPALHKELAEEARADGMTFEDYVAARLAVCSKGRLQKDLPWQRPYYDDGQETYEEFLERMKPTT